MPFFLGGDLRVLFEVMFYNLQINYLCSFVCIKYYLNIFDILYNQIYINIFLNISSYERRKERRSYIRVYLVQECQAQKTVANTVHYDKLKTNWPTLGVIQHPFLYTFFFFKKTNPWQTRDSSVIRYFIWASSRNCTEWRWAWGPPTDERTDYQGLSHIHWSAGFWKPQQVWKESKKK